MSQQLRPPGLVKLIVGMLSKDDAVFAAAEAMMQPVWGRIEIVSDVMPFTQTSYYAKQMGEPLLRKFVSFADLIDPGDLAEIKHQSNRLETELADSKTFETLNVARPINLDPGYIDQSKLVLATTKNFSHRIYIGRSMYAEATLHYQQGSWQAWPYTYPDYACGTYDDFLNLARRRLMEQLRSQKQNT